MGVAGASEGIGAAFTRELAVAGFDLLLIARRSGPLSELARRYPELSFGSYPFIRDGVYGASVVVRGTDAAALDAAVTELAALFPEMAQAAAATYYKQSISRLIILMPLN